ncbi:MAG: Fe(3+) ABC transporter substrate-binding protein [Fimbriimonadaceae bacterium]|nr:Fe(3+) ABC transporter substrate-binding protein [Alphaproteobacteria bacterium]
MTTVKIARILFTGIFGLILAFGILRTTASTKDEEVNVYSYRQPQLVQPIFDRFTEKTGIVVNTIFAKDGLIERIKAEGRNSPADILLTTDISRLTQAENAGITQPVTSDIINANVPEAWRDPNGNWFALTMRARVVYASRDRVEQDSITYADLADPKWRGRICTRSGQHDYSLGLIASIIVKEGEEAAETWLKGLRDNLAHPTSGNDRAQIKSIYSGECDIALGNTYYMGLMQTNTKEPEQQEWAKSVKILFPNAADRGTHVNVSGMVMAAHAPHQQEALALMEFLSSDEAQQIYAEVNHEYPVKPGVALSARVSSWGELKADPVPLTDVAAQRAKASEMVDRTGFDDGPNS